MRELKFHEKKLLKKVDFVQWKSDPTQRENTVLTRYYIQKRDDYVKYNRIVGVTTKLVRKLTELASDDQYRIDTTDALLNKLYTLGIIQSKSSLSQCAKITVSHFCRRRLPVIMVRYNMAPSLKEAVKFIEQGHVRVGTNVIQDPAFLVTRSLEDFVTWTNGSAIKRHIVKYHNKVDDFDLLGN